VTALILAGLLGLLTLVSVLVERRGHHKPAARVAFSELEGRGWVIWEDSSQIPLQLALF